MLVLLGAVLGLPATASATTFCVPGFTAACPDNGTNVAQPNLETALTTNGSDGTADTVVLAGQFFTTSTSFTPFGSDPLTITGAGAGSTFLGSSASTNVAVIVLNSRGATTISNLTVVVNTNHPDDGGVGIAADAGTVLRDVEVDVRNPTSSGGFGSSGVTLGGAGITLERVRIAPSGSGALGTAISILGSSSTAVTASELSIEQPRSKAIEVQDGAQLTASRVAITGVKIGGIQVRTGTATFTNLLLLATDDTVPLSVSTSGAANAALTVNHATVVSTATAGTSPPITVTSTSTGDATFTLTNSIVSGFSSGGQRATSGAGLARFIASYSFLPAPVGGSAGGVTLANMVTTQPTFTAPAGTDYSLAAGSSAIDAGTPGTAAPTVDLNGNARVLDGNGDGVAVRDLGAYERAAPTPAPTPSPTPSPAPGQGTGGGASPTPAPTPTPAPLADTTAPETRRVSGPGKRLRQRTATFRFGASEAGVRYECRLDAAKRFKACKNPLTLRALAAGKHVLRVRAVDAAGNRDATPLVLRFAVPRR